MPDRSTDKRFTGKIWDETSALYYYGARYYDPDLGRFITADPTIAHPFDPQDLNRYTYCRNNPIIYVDPSGLSWWTAFWSWVAGIFAGAVAAVVAATTFNPILAAAAGGAVYGGIMGAVNGGSIESAITGAITGFVMGAAVGAGMIMAGPLAPVLGAALVIGGGINAYKTGNWEGVGDYVAGLAGGISGFYAGSALVHGTTNIGLNGQPRSIPQNRSLAERASTALSTDAKPIGGPSESGGGYTKNVGVEDQSTYNFPVKRGFLGDPESMTLRPGTIVDRYGLPTGEFLSPQGVSPGARSLPPGVANLSLKTYQVLKPFKVYGGPAAPNYGQEGLGMQFDLGKGRSVQSLLDRGYLKEL